MTFYALEFDDASIFFEIKKKTLAFDLMDKWIGRRLPRSIGIGSKNTTVFSPD